MDEIRSIGIDVVTTALIALAAIGVPWLMAKGGKLIGHKLSDANQAKLSGFVRVGIHLAANEAKRRFGDDQRKSPLSGDALEDFAIGKAKAAAKKVGSKILDKLSEIEIVDAVRHEYEVIKAEKANVSNLEGTIKAMEATLKRIDEAPTFRDFQDDNVEKVDGRWVRKK